VLSDILLFGGLILLGLKYGLVARLRELGRVVDRLVNVLLVAIVVIYAVQLAYVLIVGRH
jgi:hypothetical protein